MDETQLLMEALQEINMNWLPDEMHRWKENITADLPEKIEKHHQPMLLTEGQKRSTTFLANHIVGIPLRKTGY